MNLDREALALPETIKRELRSIQPAKLQADWPDAAHFREDLGLDSLDLVEMVARLEQLTGIFVPDVDLPKLSSVAATAAYLRERFDADPAAGALDQGARAT
jgi:NADH dehydrogenase (ubiquinone) 1 alpha/beta subcomplex 1